jgi:tetratricopeptide (TPR) repeat protein
LGLLCALVVNAQQHKLTIDANTDEGKLLIEIGEQKDETRKQTLMEDFVAKYPKHAGATWVYGQLQSLFIKQGHYDSALDAGEKALAIDPSDLDAAYENLKASEAKKDAGLVKKWAAMTSELAHKVVGSAPAGDDAGKKKADHARQVDTYTEYSLYAAAIQSSDPRTVIDLIETLDQRNPQSRYLPLGYGNYLNALRQTGQAEKAGMLAEQMAEKGLANADVLLVAADYNLQKKTEPDKVIRYSNELIEQLTKKPKPETISDADWTAKKEMLLAVANWMAGITYGAQSKYAESDQALRAALPHLKDEQVLATGFFYLGLADFQLGKAGKKRALLEDGLKYSEQSAAIKGPLQSQAAKNAKMIRGELGAR